LLCHRPMPLRKPFTATLPKGPASKMAGGGSCSGPVMEGVGSAAGAGGGVGGAAAFCWSGVCACPVAATNVIKQSSPPQIICLRTAKMSSKSFVVCIVFPLSLIPEWSGLERSFAFVITNMTGCPSLRRIRSNPRSSRNHQRFLPPMTIKEPGSRYCSRHYLRSQQRRMTNGALRTCAFLPPRGAVVGKSAGLPITCAVARLDRAPG